MLVQKYHQPLAYLSSVEVVDELLSGAERYVQLRNALPLALRMMAVATRAGVPSDAAVHAMLLNSGGGEELGLVGLAALLEAALEEREPFVDLTRGDEHLAHHAGGDGGLVGEAEALLDVVRGLEGPLGAEQIAGAGDARGSGPAR